MRRSPEFTRRFNQLTEGETQSAVALRIGVTPSYVGQIKRGAYIPSRQVVERLAAEYGVDPDEWLTLAGYHRKPAAVPDEARIAELLDQAALRATAAVNGAQRLAQGLFELSRKYRRPVPVYLHGGAESLTVEEAERLLADFEQQLLAEIPEEEASAEQPLRLRSPSRRGRATH